MVLWADDIATSGAGRGWKMRETGSIPFLSSPFPRTSVMVNCKMAARSAMPAPFTCGPKATCKDRRLSRCKLGFGNKAAIVRPREPTPRRPSLDVWKHGLGTSARDRPLLEERSSSAHSLQTAKPTSPKPPAVGSCGCGSADVASPREACDAPDLGSPHDRGLRCRKESSCTGRKERKKQNGDDVADVGAGGNGD